MFKKLVTGVTLSAMLFSLAGCSKKADKVAVEKPEVKRYSAEEYQEIVAGALNTDKDEVIMNDVPQFSGTSVTTLGDLEVFFDVLICDDSDFSREQFEAWYETATEVIESDNFVENFDGEYNISYEDGVGYIVVDGSPIGMEMFGVANVSNENFYGGIYYIDNALVRVHSRTPEANPDDVISVIEALGYPTAEDK